MCIRVYKCIYGCIRVCIKRLPSSTLTRPHCPQLPLHAPTPPHMPPPPHTCQHACYLHLLNTVLLPFLKHCLKLPTAAPTPHSLQAWHPGSASKEENLTCNKPKPRGGGCSHSGGVGSAYVSRLGSFRLNPVKIPTSECSKSLRSMRDDYDLSACLPACLPAALPSHLGP